MQTGDSQSDPDVDDRRTALRERAHTAGERARLLVEAALHARGASTGLIEGWTDSIDRRKRAKSHAAQMRDESRQVREDLRQTVTQYALAMNALGAPPERAIVAMKQLSDEATANAFAATQDADVWAHANELRAEVVRWCVDAYFGVSG